MSAAGDVRLACELQRRESVSSKYLFCRTERRLPAFVQRKGASSRNGTSFSPHVIKRHHIGTSVIPNKLEEDAGTHCTHLMNEVFGISNATTEHWLQYPPFTPAIAFQMLWWQQELIDKKYTEDAIRSV